MEQKKEKSDLKKKPNLNPKQKPISNPLLPKGENELKIKEEEVFDIQKLEKRQRFVQENSVLAELEKHKIEEFFKFNYHFDLSKAKFELDPLQDRMLQFYIRSDPRFRRAFYTDYTADFFKFLKEKTRLQEPNPLTTLGLVRSGKSYSMLSLASFMMGCHKKLFTIDYVCANAVEFLDKLRTMANEDLKNSVFLIDEEKTATLGIGSTAKKLKMQDVSNIVAKWNITTIMVNPMKWADPDAFYGLRCFGRDFGQKVNRFMLYNTQESGRGGTLPLGNVYIPIFTDFLPDFYAKALEKDYVLKKDAWIDKEIKGESDALAELRRNFAHGFFNDQNYKSLKKKAEKMAYISYKVGSDGWTTKEIEDIYQLTNLMEQGIL